MKLCMNVGMADRVVRALVGVVLLAVYFGGMVAGALATVVLVAGVAMLATAAIGFCGLYTLLGVNTCGLKKS